MEKFMISAFRRQKHNFSMLFFLTPRISVIFRIRSAKAVKITDASLIKKLGLLCGFVSVALLIRTLVSPPDVIVGRTADNLKAFLCKTDWWDHTFTSRKWTFSKYCDLLILYVLLLSQLKYYFWHGVFDCVLWCGKLHQNSTKAVSYRWQFTTNFFLLASSTFLCGFLFVASYLLFALFLSSFDGGGRAWEFSPRFSPSFILSCTKGVSLKILSLNFYASNQRDDDCCCKAVGMEKKDLRHCALIVSTSSCSWLW